MKPFHKKCLFSTQIIIHHGNPNNHEILGTTAEVEGSSSSLRLSRSIPLRSFQWLPLVHITFNIIVIAIIIVVIVKYQQGTHTRAWCLESKAWPLVNSPPITVVHPPHRYSLSSSSWWFWMILIEMIGDPSITSQLMAGYHMVGVGPQHPTFLPRCLTIVMCLDIFLQIQIYLNMNICSGIGPQN